MKAICINCGWHGDSTDVLRAQSPFDFTKEVEACPQCKTINSVAWACDEPGCWRAITCGAQTENGYRLTCELHYPVPGKHK